MYVTTFYSFKGGVGRTMALVNVAVELALQGKRVVAVDFDLEAPGLDTFDLSRPAETTPGILDFVETYLETDRAPEAEDFLFESPPLGEKGGRLWIMPSGSHDERYARRLAALDWQALYEHFDGYLLFEDLKAQWRDSLEADYVLIDSRTGHTDVGGICTRQLPDAVVLLFFPNEQNLRGLTKVVRDIRAEPTRSEEDAINLHYVLSNVPDLDDEDEILRAITSDFQKQLGFRREPLAIHRYPSLSLLKQDIFTKDRPRSRLAHEYRTLAKEVTRLNPADREGALDYIGHYRQSLRRRPGTGSGQHRAEDRLEQIRKHHSNDGEILFRLGQLYARRGDDDLAAGLFNVAVEAGFRAPEAWLERARYRRWRLDDAEAASEDALEVFRSSGATLPDWMMALRLLVPTDLEQLPAAQGVQESAPWERIQLASNMTRGKAEAAVAMALLEPLLAPGDLEPGELETARSGAVLACMTVGNFSKAASLCVASAPSVQDMPIQLAFNYAMALWGATGDVPRDILARVVELDAAQQDDPNLNANYKQCLALAHWASGNPTCAKVALEEAAAAIRTERSSFSCWRYLTVPGLVFATDLEEMRKLIGGHPSIKPRFIRRAEESTAMTSGATPGSEGDAP